MKTKGHCDLGLLPNLPARGFGVHQATMTNRSCITMIVKWKVFAAVLAAASFVSPAVSRADTAVVNFIADVNQYFGITAFDPFTPGSVISDLENGLGGFVGNASDDWTKLVGQIVIDDYVGPGTYTASPTGGTGPLGTTDVGVYLHGALLNRIEAVSRRTAGPITFPGAGRQDGNPPVANDDIYLPNYNPLGVASVTIAPTGEVSVQYELDFTLLPPENGRFLRETSPGVFVPTALSMNLDAFGASFENITIEGSGTPVTTTATIGTDDDLIPYGGYWPLDPNIAGNLSNTIVPTTRGLIRNELSNNNILTGTGGTPIADPLTGQSGTAFFFDLTGDNLPMSVTVVPEPASAVLVGMVGLAGLGLRRHR